MVKFLKRSRKRDLLFKALFMVFYFGIIAYYIPVVLSSFITYYYMGLAFALVYNFPDWIIGNKNISI